MANFHLLNDIVLMILNYIVPKPATKHLPREFAAPASVCQHWDTVVKSDIPGIMMLGGQSHHTGIVWTGFEALRFRFCGFPTGSRGYVPDSFNGNGNDGVLKLSVDLAGWFPNVLQLNTNLPISMTLVVHLPGFLSIGLQRL
ncbi:hypothetical protein BX661DRAFT_225917 [Kickxella alabastrina]|uniref:uncharacterized protein n=1 Tax=Kickxella alabastrina TaxID=61397 RepID=UPI00221E3A78|nr:uncharacterized protein BX661DRAFT_225917 [Kickxella alabastrina]KAI7824254.1 hypothetical protein BX661DRAFT_225917 [Kickxella alabastrina]